MKIQDYKTLVDDVYKVESAIAEFKAANKAEMDAAKAKYVDYNVETSNNWIKASDDLDKAEKKAIRVFKEFMRKFDNPKWEFENKDVFIPTIFEMDTYRCHRNDILFHCSIDLS